jgi:chemotaxis protein CheX
MVAAVKLVFNTMIRLDIQFVERVTNVEPPPAEGGTQMIGNVGFGGSINGIVYLAMSEPFAVNAAGRILRMDAAELASCGPEAITDAIGEVANMTVGTFKNRLCDIGYPCMLTLPTLVRAKGLSIKGIRDTTRHVFHFLCEGERISADLHIKIG